MWDNGRGAPSLIAKEVLESARVNKYKPTADREFPNFYRYEGGGWEMVYNPKTQEVYHLQPIKIKK